MKLLDLTMPEGRSARHASGVLVADSAPPTSSPPSRARAALPAVARLAPRLHQISVLSLLLAYSLSRLDLDIETGRALAILATALLTQLVGSRLAGLPRFDPKSALISGLSLCLLVRANHAAPALAAAMVAVGSKFVLRVRGKHTVRLPTGVELSVHVKDEFARFYGAMFGEQVRREDMRVVFLEYAWDMGWCDPCAANPLAPDELRQLGVFWLADGRPQPGPRRPGSGQGRGLGPVDAFVIRLHVRYDAAHFPDDLVFQETAGRSNFQGRYVLRHPWRGEDRCEASARYREELRARAEREARALASLTGWPVEDIRRKMTGAYGALVPDDRPWWKKLWDE